MVVYDKIVFSPGELSVSHDIGFVNLVVGYLSMESTETGFGSGAVGSTPCQFRRPFKVDMSRSAGNATTFQIDSGL